MFGIVVLLKQPAASKTQSSGWWLNQQHTTTTMFDSRCVVLGVEGVKSMLSSWLFPTVVLVAESSGCINQAVLKWAQNSHQLLSIRITQKKLRGHATKKICKLIFQVAVCLFLNQQIWSYFQKTYDKIIIKPNFVNIFRWKSSSS